jgi:hypothetical protein
MVLHPIESGDRQPVPATLSPVTFAWEAVERKQKHGAEEWWLITQPDHAALAGDLAALLDTPLIPKLGDPILRAISLHDSGWARFDGGERGTGRDLEVSLRDPLIDGHGKPLSFLEMSSENFVAAWQLSIEKAAKTSDLGGLMVSEHFCRLTRTRLHSGADDPSDRQRLNDFLARQAKWQDETRGKNAGEPEQLACLTDVLQFCDLLSLYLCSGADEAVEFPQVFRGNSIRLVRKDGMCLFTPRLFGDGASLGVTARKFPSFGNVEVGTLAFLIQ